MAISIPKRKVLKSKSIYYDLNVSSRVLFVLVERYSFKVKTVKRVRMVEKKMLFLKTVFPLMRMITFFIFFVHDEYN
jgi:hypothetical protein